MQAPKDAHDCAPRQAKNILEHLHGPKRMTVTGVHVVTFSMTDDDNTTLGGGGRGGYRDYGGSLFPGAVLIYWQRKSPSFNKGHFDKGWKQTWIEADEGGTLHHVKLEEETKCWRSKHQHDSTTEVQMTDILLCDSSTLFAISMLKLFANLETITKVN